MFRHSARRQCDLHETASMNCRVSFWLVRPPVHNHVQRRSRLRIVADDQEPLAIRGNIPTHGAGADSRVDHLRVEESVRSSGLKSGGGGYIHGHHLPVRRNVEQLLTIAPPARHYAAALRKKPSTPVGSRRKGNDINLALAGFV